mmetsp:Transcript_15890/g.39822  ORF Transcript_15890/g.39822 Transcript_15890/m.39822 type:complete len:91 (+) Transcript_15890:155-427(+)
MEAPVLLIPPCVEAPIPPEDAPVPCIEGVPGFDDLMTLPDPASAALFTEPRGKDAGSSFTEVCVNCAFRVCSCFCVMTVAIGRSCPVAIA